MDELMITQEEYDPQTFFSSLGHKYDKLNSYTYNQLTCAGVSVSFTGFPSNRNRTLAIFKPCNYNEKVLITLSL